MSDPRTAPGDATAGRRAGPRRPLVIGLTAAALGLAAAGVYLSGGRLTFGPGAGLLVQDGGFESVINSEGVVYFPRRYASPPNVELAGACENTVVTDCARDHFRWKNTRTGRD